MNKVPTMALTVGVGTVLDAEEVCCFSSRDFSVPAYFDSIFPRNQTSFLKKI